MVTTILGNDPSRLIPIRSYPVDDYADPIRFNGRQWKIWEAARAATAAPVYFRPLKLDRVEFMDAGLGFNNPSAEVLHEVTNNIPEYQNRPIACFVSIGTGARPSHHGPSMLEREVPTTISRYFLDKKGAIARGRELINFLSVIASNPLYVHREMDRRMPNG
jgi:hypothetical protein